MFYVISKKWRWTHSSIVTNVAVGKVQNALYKKTNKFINRQANRLSSVNLIFTRSNANVS